jgi:hypothetical protein
MIEGMEGFGGLFGDPEEMRRRMEELQEQMQGAQKVVQVRDAIRIVFPEAVTLVREAREGLQD